MFVATNRIRTKKGFGDGLEGSFAVLGDVEGQISFLSFEVRLITLPHEDYGLPIPNEAFSLS